jgi:hypothetical protein
MMATMTGFESVGRFWRPAMWGLIAALLLLPLVAMQFTREVAWDAADFVFAGVLLIGAGLIFELTAWRTKRLVWRLAIGGALIFVVLLIWAHAAVGVF